MSYSKLIFIVATAVICLTSATSASATILTRGDGTTMGTGTSINFQLEGGHTTVIKSSFIGEVVCSKSLLSGKVEHAGGAAETVSGSFSSMSFESCNATVTVLKSGSFEVHTRGTNADNNGTLTMSGQEITVELAGLHCIFGTSNTDVGEIVGSGATPFLWLSGIIPRTGGRSGAFCGSTMSWTGLYEITTTFGLNVD